MGVLYGGVDDTLLPDGALLSATNGAALSTGGLRAATIGAHQSASSAYDPFQHHGATQGTHPPHFYKL
jgi:hypothetical protein